MVRHVHDGVRGKDCGREGVKLSKRHGGSSGCYQTLNCGAPRNTANAEGGAPSMQAANYPCCGEPQVVAWATVPRTQYLGKRSVVTCPVGSDVCSARGSVHLRPEFAVTL